MEMTFLIPSHLINRWVAFNELVIIVGFICNTIDNNNNVNNELVIVGGG